jgi:hypothetical protein
MVKKTKKRSNGGPRLSERQLHQPGMGSIGGAITTAPLIKAPVAAAQPADEDLAAEYRYVLTDLKKIAWLALTMLVLLVALAFIVV